MIVPLELPAYFNAWVLHFSSGRTQPTTEYEREWRIWSWFFNITSYVEHRKYPGWSGYLPFYKYKCEKHGTVVNYLQGHRKILRCQKCEKENK